MDQQTEMTLTETNGELALAGERSGVNSPSARPLISTHTLLAGVCSRGETQSPPDS